MKLKNVTEIQKQRVINYLRETGNISRSCSKARFDRNLFYRLFYQDKDFMNMVMQARSDWFAEQNWKLNQ